MALVTRYFDPSAILGLDDGTSEANAWQSWSSMEAGVEALFTADADSEVIVWCKQQASRHTGSDVTFKPSPGPSSSGSLALVGYDSTIGDGGLFQANYRISVGWAAGYVEGLDAESSGITYALDVSNITAIRCRGKTTNQYAYGIALNNAFGIGCVGENTGSLQAGRAGIYINTGSCLNCIGISDLMAFRALSNFRASAMVGCHAILGASAASGSVGFSVSDPTNSQGCVIQNCSSAGFDYGIEVGNLPTQQQHRVLVSECVLWGSVYAIRDASASGRTTLAIGRNYYGSMTSGFSNLGAAFGQMEDRQILLTADPFVDSGILGDLTLNETAGGGATVRSAGDVISSQILAAAGCGSVSQFIGGAVQRASGGGGSPVTRGWAI